MDTNMAQALRGKWSPPVSFVVSLSWTGRPFQLNTELPTTCLFNKDKSHPQCFVSCDIIFNQLFVYTPEQQDHAVPERSADGLQSDRVPLADCVRHASQRRTCGAEEESHCENRLWEQVRYSFPNLTLFHQTDLLISFHLRGLNVCICELLISSSRNIELNLFKLMECFNTNVYN